MSIYGAWHRNKRRKGGRGEENPLAQNHQIAAARSGFGKWSAHVVIARMITAIARTTPKLNANSDSCPFLPPGRQPMSESLERGAGRDV
jgi:hypothetical protein